MPDIVLTPGTPVNSSVLTSLTVPLPAGLTDGDWVMLIGAVNATGPVLAPPADYTTEILPATASTAQTAVVGGTWAKKWVSGDTDPVLSVNGRSVGICVRVSGADSTTLIDAAAATPNQVSSGTTITADSVTPGVTGAALVRLFFARGNSASATVSFSTPTGHTDAGYAPGVTTSTNASAAAFYRIDTTAGVASGSATTTASRSLVAAFGTSFTIKPASSVSPASLSGSGTLDAIGSVSVSASLSGSGAVTTLDPSPSAIRQTGFELGSNGATIAAYGANGGDDFTSRGETGSTGTATYDSSVATAIAAGSFAAKFTTGATASQPNWRGWRFPDTGVLSFRKYIYLTAYPNAGTTVVAAWQGGVQRYRVVLGTNGTFTHANGSTFSSSSGAAIALNTLMRIEGKWDLAAGTFILDVYNGHSITPLAGGIGLTGLSFATATVDEARMGLPQGQPTNFSMWTDGWAITSSGTRPGAITPTASVSATLSGSGTLAGGTSLPAVATSAALSGSGSLNATGTKNALGIILTAGTAAQSSGSVTSITVTLPSGLVAGDYTLLFAASNSSAGGLTAPAGWTTVLASTDSVNGSTSVHGAVYAKAWQSGDANPVVGLTNGRVGVLPVRVQNASLTGVVDVAAAVTQAAASATTVVAPTRTPVTSGAALMTAYFSRHATANTFITYSTPSGMTSVGYARGNDTTTTNSSVGVFSESNEVAGVATGTRSSTTNLATSGAFGTAFTVAPASATSFTGSANLTGDGALATTGTPSLPVAASLSGSGSLSAAGGVAVTRTAATSGSGSLSVQTVPQFVGAGTLSGSGTLTATSIPRGIVSAALSGSGTLTAAGSAKAETFVDLFNTQNNAMWTFTTNASVSGGELQLSPTSAFPRISSIPTADILGSHWGGELAARGTAATAASQSVRVFIDNNNYIELSVSVTGGIGCILKVAGTFILNRFAGQVANAQCYRIRVSAARVVTWEANVNGRWLTIHTGVTVSAGFDLGNVILQILAGSSSAAGTTNSRWASVGSYPSSPTVTNTAIDWGVATGSAPPTQTELDAVTTRAQRAPHIALWYRAWVNNFDSTLIAAMETLRQQRKISLLTWEMWDWTNTTSTTYTLANVIAGNFDTYITNTATALRDWGGPVYIRLFHEFNAPLYPWCVGFNGNSITDFIPAWQHVVDIFRTVGANNVKWVWSPNQIDSVGELAQCWPGTNYVDVVGVDAYNFGDGATSSWTWPAQVFDGTLNEIRAISETSTKPLWICETASSTDGGSKSGWIDDLAKWALSTPDLDAIVWFDTDKEEHWEFDVLDPAGPPPTGGARDATAFRALVAQLTSYVDATLSGSGTLTATGVQSISRTAALSGSGSLSATSVPAVASSIAFSGSGTLSTTSTLSIARTTALSGSGSLTTTQTPAVTRPTAFSGTGSLTTTQTAAVVAAASLSGSGSLTTATTPRVTLSAALTGAGIVTVTAGSSGSTIAALSGSGEVVTRTMLVGSKATAVLSGSGTLAATIVLPASRALADFTTIDSVWWLIDPAAAVGDVTTNAGRLQLLGKTTWASNLYSKVRYDLRNSSVMVELVQAANSGDYVDTYFALRNTADQEQISFDVEWIEGSLHLNTWTLSSGVYTQRSDTAYNSTTHRWLRFREVSGTTYWETSSDTVSWTTQYSSATPATVGSNTIVLGVGGGIDGGTALFDNINNPPLSASATLSGSGTLSSTTKLGVAATAALSGSGSVGTSLSGAATVSASLSGSGSLSTAVTPRVASVATLSGAGSLAATGGIGAVSAVTLSGSGSLAASTVPSVVAATTFSGTGSLTSATTPRIAVSAALSGAGSLATSLSGGAVVTATLAGSGTLSIGQVLPQLTRSATLSGSGSLIAAQIPRIQDTAIFSGLGTLVGASVARLAANAQMSGLGSLAALGIQHFVRTGSFSGLGTLAGRVRLFAAAPVRVWNGTTWVERFPQKWTGTQWVIVPIYVTNPQPIPASAPRNVVSVTAPRVAVVESPEPEEPEVPTYSRPFLIMR